MVQSSTKKPSAVGIPPYVGKVSLAALLVALALSAYNLTLTIGTTGELNGLSQSWDALLGNYGTRIIASAEARSAVDSSPVLLWSIVHFRTGESETLPRDLVGPIFAHYETSDNPVSVLLVERKNVNSRDVNVRLFFKDGTELSYLWPRTHATEDGVWRIGE